MPKYEYAALPWTGAGIDGMNEMGADGWEAFAVHDGMVLYRRAHTAVEVVFTNAIRAPAA